MVEEKQNTKEVGKFNRISNSFQIVLSIIGIIWSGKNVDKPGSVFLIGFLSLLIITATISLCLSESNPEKARYFAGGAIGLFLSLLLILVFGFSKIDVNPIFRPYSREANARSESWSSRKTATEEYFVSARKTALFSDTNSVNISPTNTATPTSTSTQKPTQVASITPTITSTPAPTFTPTPYLGHLFIVNHLSKYAAPINEFQDEASDIGAVPNGSYIRIDGISSDGLWLRVLLSQDSLIIFPNVSVSHGWIFHDKLDDFEINRDALPVISITQTP